MWRVTPGVCHCTSSYIANDCGLSVLIITIWNLASIQIIYNLAILREIKFMLNPQPQFSFFSWFSHLDIVLYSRVPKFLCSLKVSTVTSWEMCGHLFRSFLHLRVSGNFSSRWDSFFSCGHRRPFTLDMTGSGLFKAYFRPLNKSLLEIN